MDFVHLYVLQDPLGVRHVLRAVVAHLVDFHVPGGASQKAVVICDASGNTQHYIEVMGRVAGQIFQDMARRPPGVGVVDWVGVTDATAVYEAADRATPTAIFVVFTAMVNRRQRKQPWPQSGSQ